MRKRIQIILVKCRRGCGKTLGTASRSIWGVDENIRKKYQGICDSCLTETEKKEMWQAQVDAVARKVKGQ